MTASWKASGAPKIDTGANCLRLFVPVAAASPRSSASRCAASAKTSNISVMASRSQGRPWAACGAAAVAFRADSWESAEEAFTGRFFEKRRRNRLRAFIAASLLRSVEKRLCNIARRSAAASSPPGRYMLGNMHSAIATNSAMIRACATRTQFMVRAMPRDGPTSTAPLAVSRRFANFTTVTA